MSQMDNASGLNESRSLPKVSDQSALSNSFRGQDNVSSDGGGSEAIEMPPSISFSTIQPKKSTVVHSSPRLGEKKQFCVPVPLSDLSMKSFQDTCSISTQTFSDSSSMTDDVFESPVLYKNSRKKSVTFDSRVTQSEIEYSDSEECEIEEEGSVDEDHSSPTIVKTIMKTAPSPQKVKRMSVPPPPPARTTSNPDVINSSQQIIPTLTGATPNTIGYYDPNYAPLDQPNVSNVIPQHMNVNTMNINFGASQQRTSLPQSSRPVPIRAVPHNQNNYIPFDSHNRSSFMNVQRYPVNRPQYFFPNVSPFPPREPALPLPYSQNPYSYYQNPVHFSHSEVPQPSSSIPFPYHTNTASQAIAAPPYFTSEHSDFSSSHSDMSSIGSINSNHSFPLISPTPVLPLSRNNPIPSSTGSTTGTHKMFIPPVPETHFDYIPPAPNDFSLNVVNEDLKQSSPFIPKKSDSVPQSNMSVLNPNDLTRNASLLNDTRRENKSSPFIGTQCGSINQESVKSNTFPKASIRNNALPGDEVRLRSAVNHQQKSILRNSFLESSPVPPEPGGSGMVNSTSLPSLNISPKTPLFDNSLLGSVFRYDKKGECSSAENITSKSVIHSVNPKDYYSIPSDLKKHNIFTSILPKPFGYSKSNFELNRIDLDQSAFNSTYIEGNSCDDDCLKIKGPNNKIKSNLLSSANKSLPDVRNHSEFSFSLAPEAKTSPPSPTIIENQNPSDEIIKTISCKPLDKILKPTIDNKNERVITHGRSSKKQAKPLSLSLFEKRTNREIEPINSAKNNASFNTSNQMTVTRFVTSIDSDFPEDDEELGFPPPPPVYQSDPTPSEQLTTSWSKEEPDDKYSITVSSDRSASSSEKNLHENPSEILRGSVKNQEEIIEVSLTDITLDQVAVLSCGSDLNIVSLDVGTSSQPSLEVDLSKKNDTPVNNSNVESVDDSYSNTTDSPSKIDKPHKTESSYISNWLRSSVCTEYVCDGKPSVSLNPSEEHLATEADAEISKTSLNSSVVESVDSDTERLNSLQIDEHDSTPISNSEHVSILMQSPILSCQSCVKGIPHTSTCSPVRSFQPFSPFVKSPERKRETSKTKCKFSVAPALVFNDSSPNEFSGNVFDLPLIQPPTPFNDSNFKFMDEASSEASPRAKNLSSDPETLSLASASDSVRSLKGSISEDSDSSTIPGDLDPLRLKTDCPGLSQTPSASTLLSYLSESPSTSPPPPPINYLTHPANFDSLSWQQILYSAPIATSSACFSSKVGPPTLLYFSLSCDIKIELNYHRNLIKFVLISLLVKLFKI